MLTMKDESTMGLGEYLFDYYNRIDEYLNEMSVE